MNFESRPSDDYLRWKAWRMRRWIDHGGARPEVSELEKYEIAARGLAAGSSRNPCPVPDLAGNKPDQQLLARLHDWKRERAFLQHT